MCLWCIYYIYLFHHVYWKEKAAWGCSTSLSGSIIIQLHHRNLQFHESTVGRTWVVHRTCEISSSFIACNFRYTWRIWINLTNVPILDPIGSYWILLDPIGSYWPMISEISQDQHQAELGHRLVGCESSEHLVPAAGRNFCGKHWKNRNHSAIVYLLYIWGMYIPYIYIYT